jgi:nicotinamide-nucleotide amidase
MKRLHSRTLKVLNLSEAEVSSILSGVVQPGETLKMKVLPKLTEVHIQLELFEEEAIGKEIILGKEREIRARLGNNLYGADDETLEMIVGYLLYMRNLTLSVAESCTGGLISHRLTNVPGASRYFQGGIIAYSNEVKESLLGVNPSILREFGAVSLEVATAMAEGISNLLKTNLGLGITGIAGPTGGTPKKPVGLVCIALHSAKETLKKEFHFRGEREEIKEKTSQAALDLVRRYLQE